MEADSPKASGTASAVSADLPAAQAPQDPAEEAGILAPGGLQGGVRRERDLGVLPAIAHPRHRHGQLLVEEVDRAPLAAPADHAGAAPGAAVAGARELPDCLLEGRGDGLQAERDERLDAGDEGRERAPLKADLTHRLFPASPFQDLGLVSALHSE